MTEKATNIWATIKETKRTALVFNITPMEILTTASLSTISDKEQERIPSQEERYTMANGTKGDCTEKAISQAARDVGTLAAGSKARRMAKEN